MSKEAMKLALEALEGMAQDSGKFPAEIPAIKALQEALAEQPAQQQQQPVAYIEHHKGGDNLVWDNPGANSSPLYTSPPTLSLAQCKPTDEMVVAAARMLSDRQAAACNVDCGDMWMLHSNDFIDDARAALEAAHGIKGDA